MRSQPTSWNKLATKLGLTRKRRRKTTKNAYARKLRFEHCEDRKMLATITVDVADDVTDAGDGETTLREAVAAAASGDTIDFHSSLSGATITLTQDDIEITKSLTIDGSALASKVTIEADTNERIFTIDVDNNTIEDIEIDSLILTGGDVQSGDKDGHGGAIFFHGRYNNAGTDTDTIKIIDSTISGSTAAASGGGLYLRADNFDPYFQPNFDAIVIQNSEVSDNTAETKGGGAHIVLHGSGNGFTKLVSANISGSTFDGNTANGTSDADGDHGGGGGLYLRIGDDDFGAEATITNTVISNNTAEQYGGGLFVLLYGDGIDSDAAKFTINDSEITGNTADTSSGGGIYVCEKYGGTLVADNITVSSNTAYTDGGGIVLARHEDGSGFEFEATITNSRIEKNETNTDAGAGIFTSGTHLLLDSVAIVGNDADTTGGGLYNDILGGTTTTILNSVIAHNSADTNGGGIQAFKDLILGNTVIANNDSTTGEDDLNKADSGSTLTSWGHNRLTTVDSAWTATLDEGDDLISDTADYVVTTKDDTANVTTDEDAFSLREAVIDANSGGGTIWVPAWHLVLTIDGTGGDTEGDLDITDDVTILGVGPGLTVIDGGGDGGIDDRLFQIASSGNKLDLSRVTLTGGHTTSSSSHGGAIRVASDGEVELDNVAIVDNYATGRAGAIYNYRGKLTIRNSVVTENESEFANSDNGAIVSEGRPSSTFLTIGNTIIANNRVDVDSTPIDRDIAIDDSTPDNEGNNRITVSTGHDNFFDVNEGDILDEVPDYVVTSIADEVDDTNDPYAFSLREAVIAANANTGLPTEEVIWLPSWLILLAIEDDGGGDAESGKLTISDDLEIQGIDSSGQDSTIDADPILALNAVFEEIGGATLTTVDVTSLPKET